MWSSIGVVALWFLSSPAAAGSGFDGVPDPSADDAGAPRSAFLGALTNNGVQMQGVNLQGASMQGIRMQGVSMQGISLNGSKLNGSKVNGSKVNAPELTGDAPTAVTVDAAPPANVSLSVPGVVARDGVLVYAP